MEIIKKYEQDDHFILTSDNVDEYLSNNSIEYIFFKLGSTIENTLYADTSSETPFVVEDDELYINEQWYKENIESGKALLKRIISANKGKKLEFLSSDLIDEDIISVIEANTNIEELDLGTDYKLTVEMYSALKKTNLKAILAGDVVDELKYVFDPFIKSNYERNLIGYKSYKELIKAKEVEILEKGNLEYLYLLPSSCKITVSGDNHELLESLLNTDCPNEIEIKISDNKAFYEYLNSHPITRDGVFVARGIRRVPLDLYIRGEKRLNDMIKGIESLSPFEKYLYIYNQVKTFKEYKENEEDLQSSRNVYMILENEYMVCVGFSEMLIELCQRANIPAIDYSTAVDVSYDKYDRGKEELEIEKKREKELHARTFIYLKDPKYGIDGYYLADATWDNYLNKDSYGFAALTSDERLAGSRFIFSNYNSGEEFFDAKDVDEFFAKVNFQLNKLRQDRYRRELNKKQKDVSAQQNLESEFSRLFGNSSSNFKQDEEVSDAKKVIDNILEILETINPSYVNSLKEKFPALTKKIKEVEKQELYDVITELGHHITSMNNKQIQGIDLITAVGVIYKKMYGYNDEEFRSKMHEMIEFNKNSYSKKFPVRTLEYKDGHTEVYKDVPNKYDIEEETVIKSL